VNEHAEPEAGGAFFMIDASYISLTSMCSKKSRAFSRHRVATSVRFDASPAA